MEGSLPSGSITTAGGGSFGLLDLQNPIHMHHQQQPHPSFQNLLHGVFPPSECDQHATVPVTGEHGKPSTSEEDELSFTFEEGTNDHNEAGKGKKASPWQRMKWTDQMVRLLITAVSYLGEDAAADCAGGGGGGRRKFAILQKKGKWKSISKALAERDCYVSPQQCEDKFNDLNKRYKRLTDILGRGTSCKVVENPALLDVMDNLSDKAKDDVRKILSSKHLFYEEMCSYHNNNRLHLPADPALHRSLQLALRSGDEHEKKRPVQEGRDEDGEDSDDLGDEVEDHIAPHGDIGGPCSHKRTKQVMDHEEVGLGNPLGSQGGNRRPQTQCTSVDINQVFPEGLQSDLVQKQFLVSHKLQLEEQSLQIQAQMLDLKRQRFKWQRFSKKKDRELDKMKLENKRMKLENERLQLELKRRELDLDHH
ncbi:uncharacterized protein M6B38_363505 [Iris pallida]|uniref:Myb/SANT-like DNA-binding domain-containing protein n=1 Tax=Iris pallida TaxID=29817 RepID=A0AAX6GJE8_IRIPA|nr:uncharacterized protein M6B38_394595 [Iris pallida]KAJ6828428.1 uncharacterized protein M6B38_363505 [Iris pallida]